MSQDLADLGQGRPGTQHLTSQGVPEPVRADRVDFRPKHRLTVLVVQASPLPSPVTVARTFFVPFSSSFCLPPTSTRRESSRPTSP